MTQLHSLLRCALNYEYEVKREKITTLPFSDFLVAHCINIRFLHQLMVSITPF